MKLNPRHAEAAPFCAGGENRETLNANFLAAKWPLKLKERCGAFLVAHFSKCADSGRDVF